MSVLVDVNTQSSSYPIIISNNNDYNQIKNLISKKNVVIVTNKTIAPLYLSLLKDAIIDIVASLSICILPDGEKFKNQDSVNQIHSQLLSENYTRDSWLIALGGGVIGDISGFAASIYQRGISYIQVPTTLLSCVDSSVGGKTAINHLLGKNMIGSFYQPRSVLIGTNMLQSLPKREYFSGLAEVIKYGCIMDSDFFNWIEKNKLSLKNRDENVLVEAIYKSCVLKASVVKKDEFERLDIRALLNFGHTFAHGIETIENYSSYLHGEAVSVGMLIAAELSYLLGHIHRNTIQVLESLLRFFELPIKVPQHIKTGELIKVMARDKKNIDSKITFILLQSLGNAIILRDIDTNNIELAINNRRN